jgi:hypothetical protein
MHRALACVLGDLDLIRPLGRPGIRCAVVAPPGSVNTKSRFARAVIPWSDEEIADGGADLLDALMRFAARTRDAPVLYYGEDEQLLFVSRHRETLARAFRFVIAEPGLVEDLVDKARFMQLAERLRMPVPATRHVRPGTRCAVPEIGLRFPLVAKPLRRRRSWYEHDYTAKALQIASQSELRQWWPRWAQQGIELLLQELIPGPETCIESYHVYVDQRGEIASEFTGRKICTLPAELGHSTALTITDAVDVAAVGRALVEAMRLRDSTSSATRPGDCTCSRLIPGSPCGVIRARSPVSTCLNSCTATSSGCHARHHLSACMRVCGGAAWVPIGGSEGLRHAVSGVAGLGAQMRSQPDRLDRPDAVHAQRMGLCETKEVNPSGRRVGCRFRYRTSFSIRFPAARAGYRGRFP